jgi:selenocysteine-specific elongation factor
MPTAGGSETRPTWMMTMPPPKLVVGTAGHIDHGKSRLVWTLTGTDPDRLPEEKARGMTIDLGFAHTRIEDADVWFVDVPGHERFIRNMVAGASGVDLALLVVAADDSVMPQTREHAELLSLLGVERVVITLTKMDLVDDDWAAGVEQEAAELLSGLGLTPVACVRTSAESGRGLDELRTLLSRLARARQAASRAEPAWFRMPIDRAFNVPGRGVVVTGSVAHGALSSEQTLELWPAGHAVRVRDLQTHNEASDAVSGRMRLAANLASVALADVRRGCELAAPGYLEATQRLDVSITVLRTPAGARRSALRLRLHIATSEALAELRLIEKPAEETVRGTFGQLRVAQPIVAAWGQRFILRDESGQRTLGGGRVLRPRAAPWSAKRPPEQERLVLLAGPDALRRLEETIRSLEWQRVPPAALAARAGLRDADEAAALCRRLCVEGRAIALGAGANETLVHAATLADLTQDISRRLRERQAAQPRWPGAPRGEWTGWMPRACPARLRVALADWLIERQAVRVVAGHVLPLDAQEALAPADRQLLDAVLHAVHDAAFQPPDPLSLPCVNARNSRRARELLELAVARGWLIRVADGVFLHAERWRELTERVVATIEQGGGITIAALRDLTQSSRKFVVPIAELLDARGITKRVGDERVLGPHARSQGQSGY